MDAIQNSASVSRCFFLFALIANILAASLLLQRWKKATEMNTVAIADYSTHVLAVKGIPVASRDVGKCYVIITYLLLIGEVSEKQVEEWIEAEKHLILSDEKFEPTRMLQDKFNVS